MKPILYAHPFSSYCQKALIALYENDIDFTYRTVGSPDDPDAGRELAAHWPLAKFPLLVDGDRTLFEASIIIEHLQIAHPGPVRLIPEDPAMALDARMLDRVFDNYVMTPMQHLVADALRPEAARDPFGCDAARALLDKSYAWLDARLPSDGWALPSGFSLADCAAAPSLFYADWAHPIPDHLTRLKSYRAGLLARPSFARAIEEARPFRPYFPLGAPDRD